MVRTWKRRDARQHWSGRASHLGEWPLPGPGGPGRRATRGHGGRTLNRTFYGPHLEATGCPPALARARPSTPGNGHDLDRGSRQKTDRGPQRPDPGPGGFSEGQLRQDPIRRRSKSGHSKVRTPRRGDPRQHSIPRGYVRSSGILSLGLIVAGIIGLKLATHSP